ncbi:unnamed protein product [marine sediment metagenome]|uniref:Uncharacterized protein n=1 Tax=marine sediment metagenome TaxID=412755 RepID=X1ATT6_9ZZZZ
MSKDDTLEVIYSYTRRQALADGVLIDATELAKEAGFVYPVAMTSAAWTHCVRVPDQCPWQDETGRLWDVLWMLFNAVKRDQERNPIQFSVFVQNGPGLTSEVTLKAVCGPGDDGAPVVTIMLPTED